MGEVINLGDFRKKKKSDNSQVVEVFKDSLNNEAVKRRYGIKTKEPSLEERTKNIKESIDRINNLMRELKENNK